MSASSRRSPPRPAAQRPAVVASSADAAAEHEHELGARRIAQAQRLRRQTWAGGISLASLLIAGVVALLYWRHEQSVAAAARAEIARVQDAFRAEILAFDLRDAAAAQRAAQQLETTRSQWEQWPSAGEFAEIEKRARSAVATANRRASLVAAIEDVERQAAAPQHELAEWFALRARVRGLANDVGRTDKDLEQRLLACAERVDEGCLAALRSVIDAGADAQSVRTHLAAAQELVWSKLEDAERAHDKLAHARWNGQFLAFAKQEDALAAARWDDAAVAALPWQELLPGLRTADWVHSSTQGLRHAVDGPRLAIELPATAAPRGGVVVLRDRVWRHCEVAFDLTLERGAATVLLRAGKRPDPRTAAAVKFIGAEAPHAVTVPPGRGVPVTLRLVGSRLAVRAGDTAIELPVPARARSGAFAVVVEPGTSLSIERLRLKELP